MGVSGSGKSTVGLALADLLGVPFADADDLHPAANVAKMAAGTPLTDADRWPWLDLVGRALADAPQPGLVVACSALKRSYRDAVRAAAPATEFVHLVVPRAVLGDRVANRPGHFMPATLVDSQLETLEALDSDEAGVVVDSEGGVDATAQRALLALN
jgi:carbohydrate kinase (thermoresistant glucokinase family)